MKTTSHSNEPQRDEARIRELLAADRQEIEPPRELLDRVRARLHENTVRSPAAVPARATVAWTKKAWFAAAAAAALALIALLFCLQPSSIAWSQVANAVRAVPWIHIKTVYGRGQSREVWISFSRDICAVREVQMVEYADFRSGIRCQYDLPQKKLYRLSVNSVANEEIEWLQGLFQAIFRGDAIRERGLFRLRIVKQQQRTVTEQGRQWLLYELELEPQGGGPKPPIETPPISMIIRVNPEKMLPESWTITQGKFTATLPGSKKAIAREELKGELAFDYPAEGPADIYALGVPRDAPVDDRMPPPDLDRILKIVRQNRQDFGDYLAVASGQRALVHLIRCKGDKFRVDAAAGDARRVTSGNEMENWWQNWGREVIPTGLVLCDGRSVYQWNFVQPGVGWKPLGSRVPPGDGRAAAASTREAEYFVELLAYPPNLDLQTLSLPQYTAHLDPQGENGPAGSIRVEFVLAKRQGPKDLYHVDDSRAYHKEEFWLQPRYGYAVVKHVFSDCPGVEKDPLRKEIVAEYDGFRRTPRGLWYPTVSRNKNASQSPNKSAPGGVELHDQVTCFYLDFAAELPDELFTTAWQGDLLRSIQFPRPDEKAASSDLRKIRPPGGVPLLASRAEITVEAMEQVRRRMEAAPAELDKWADEMERISGQKFTSWLERQGCRSEFANRMSLAFDGPRWNAKSAGNLFQRARSVPPAEVKAWKEAAERLLKGEVSGAYRTYDVVFVLIPIDALFHGQKYNPQRAEKYRARLRQLTVDDVAIWTDKVDQCGGTWLDAAMNIILLDDYFDHEKFQRDKFKAAIAARKNR